MDRSEINNLINAIKAELTPVCRRSFYSISEINKQWLSRLNKLAEFLLVYQEDYTIRCRYKYLQLWRKYTISLESDLLIAVFLAARSIRLKCNVERFDWKIVIDHDNEVLNSILRQGIVDNHYHLGGALLIFQCTWVNLMENEQCRNRIFHSSNEMPILTRAALIRKQLINFLNRKGICIFQEKCQESVQDYYNERKFLYYIIRELLKTNANKMDNLKDTHELLYEYLVIKEQIRKRVVQSGDCIGEHFFWKVNQNKNMMLERSVCIGNIIRSSVCEQIHSNYIKILEVRIKMKDSSKDLYEYIAWLERQLGSLSICVQYIICFSRSKSFSFRTDQSYRDQSKRMEVFEKYRIFKEFLNTNHTLAKKVVGVDICSKESNYKPEVFVEIMRRKKNSLDMGLKRMYHTGETYTDLLSGLRAIDESISFFDLGSGDRLGHAMPIFENVKKWYNSRENRIVISKEDYLDNIVWLYCNASDDIQRGEIGKEILSNFKKQFYDLYYDAFSYKLLSTLKLNEKLELEKISIFHYFEAWCLRRIKPEEIKAAIENNIYIGSPMSNYITYCYFYNTDVKKRGSQSLELYISNDQIQLISNMQNRVLKKINEKKICIEICPSSSILMGTAKNGYCHPIINWFKHSGKEFNKNSICISINTDDQGIFSTSLISEYSLIASALEKEMNSKEERESLYKWINDVRKNSIYMCKCQS